MTNSGSSVPPGTEASPDEEQALLDKARNDAQVRVAEVHVEEGTVKSEKNLPHSHDHD